MMESICAFDHWYGMAWHVAPEITILIPPTTTVSSPSFHVDHISRSLQFSAHSSDSSQSTSAGLVVDTRTGYSGPLLHTLASNTPLCSSHTSHSAYTSAMSGPPERDLDPEELEQEEAFGESAGTQTRSS